MAEAQQERGLVTYQSRDGQDIRLSFDTVRKYLVSGHPEMVTDHEIVLYMGMCKARGLNPFKKDCYLVKYTTKDPAATIVSIDYFRSRAKAQPDCVGWKSGIMLLGEDRKIEYREGSFLLDDEKLVGAWFKAKPKDWTEEYTWTVPLKPFLKTTREGQVTQFWQPEKQSYMIVKVVESQGLRRLWPDEFQGIFVEEDTGPRDITPQGDPAPALRIPQPTKENADAQTDRSAGTDGNPRTTAARESKDGSNGDISNAQQGRTDSSVPGEKTSTAEANPSDSPKGDEGGKPAATAAKEKPKEKENSNKDVLLEMISKFTDQTFPVPTWLNPYLKEIPKEDHVQITMAFDAKRKELGI